MAISITSCTVRSTTCPDGSVFHQVNRWTNVNRIGGFRYGHVGGLAVNTPW